MKLANLAFKRLWAARLALLVPLMGAALGIGGVGVAATYFEQMNAGLNKPCTLTVVGESLNDNKMAELSLLPNVTFTSPVIDINAKLTSDEYSASITLKGVSEDVIPIEGMDVVLSEATIGTFVSEGGLKPSGTEWREKVSLSIVPAEDSGITIPPSYDVKIIEKEKGDYINLEFAKKLAREEGKSTSAYSSIFVRIKNVDYAEETVKAITKMGFTATHDGVEILAEVQKSRSSWEQFIVGGILAWVLSAFYLESVLRRLEREKVNERDLLITLGMNSRLFRRLDGITVWSLSGIYCTVGIILALLITKSTPTVVSILVMPLIVVLNSVFVLMLRRWAKF